MLGGEKQLLIVEEKYSFDYGTEKMTMCIIHYMLMCI